LTVYDLYYTEAGMVFPFDYDRLSGVDFNIIINLLYKSLDENIDSDTRLHKTFHILKLTPILFGDIYLFVFREAVLHPRLLNVHFIQYVNRLSRKNKVIKGSL
jgi:hypothetical protein